MYNNFVNICILLYTSIHCLFFISILGCLNVDLLKVRKLHTTVVGTLNNQLTVFDKAPMNVTTGNIM